MLSPKWRIRDKPSSRKSPSSSEIVVIGVVLQIPTFVKFKESENRILPIGSDQGNQAGHPEESENPIRLAFEHL